jgi:hypothetical protein
VNRNKGSTTGLNLWKGIGAASCLLLHLRKVICRSNGPSLGT